jgi:hypothetical protein
MDCLNSALFIAIQCGVAGVAWGTTGVGKSAFLKALADELGYKFFCFIPSQHMPEDIGGIPDIDRKTKVASMIPMQWIKALTEPGWMLMIDELTTAPQPMRPPILSVLNEGCIGELCFHPSTIRVAAANPPEMAPNSSPLEASMLNRLYHHDWETPFDTWYKGMLNGGKFEMPSNIPVVGDYSAYVPKWTGIIGRLCHRQPAIRECRVIPEGERAFASLRQWYNLARVLAGADKVKASGEVVNQLATGMVGQANAAQLMRWIAAADLYDSGAVIDGTVTISYDNDRIDTLIYLPVGIMEALRDDHSDKRLDRAGEVLIEMGEHGMVDSIMPVLGEIGTTYPDYRMPKKLLARYGSLIKQIGGAN